MIKKFFYNDNKGTIKHNTSRAPINHPKNHNHRRTRRVQRTTEKQQTIISTTRKHKQTSWLLAATRGAGCSRAAPRRRLNAAKPAVLQHTSSRKSRRPLDFMEGADGPRCTGDDYLRGCSERTIDKARRRRRRRRTQLILITFLWCEK